MIMIIYIHMKGTFYRPPNKIRNVANESIRIETKYGSNFLPFLANLREMKAFWRNLLKWYFALPNAAGETGNL